MCAHEAVHGAAPASRRDRIMRQYCVRLPLVKRESSLETDHAGGSFGRPMAVGAPSSGCVGFGGAGQQAGPGDAVSGNVAGESPRTPRRACASESAGPIRGCASWSDRMRRISKSRARPHEVAALAHQLNFAGGIGHGAALLESGERRQNDIGQARRFGKIHVLHDQQIELAETLRAHEVASSSRDLRPPRTALSAFPRTAASSIARESRPRLFRQRRAPELAVKLRALRRCETGA